MSDNQNKSSDSVFVDTNAKLLQELQNYQIELEKQNESLRQTQIALEESNRRYADLCDFLPVAYLILTKQGLIKEINPTGIALFGAERQDLLEQRFSNFISLKECNRWQQFFNQQITQNSQQTIDLELKPVQGIVRYVQVNCRMVQSSNSPELQMTLTDITELKLTEQQLQESEERLNLCQNYGGVATWDIDLINNRLVWSPSVYEVLKFPYFSNPSFEDLLSLVHSEDRQLILDALQAHFYQGKKYEVEYRAYLADDQWHWLCSAGQAQFAPDGTPLHFMGCTYDITERKTLEQIITESRNLFRTVVDTVPSRIFWKDRDCRLLGCNMALVQDANVTRPQDLIGKDVSQTIWAKYAKIFEADDRAVMESGIPKLSYDEFIEIEEGKAFWCRTSKVPLKNQAGEIIGLVGIYEDITERKRIEQRLQESERKLAAVFDILDFGIAITDDQGNIIDCNKCSEMILCISKQEMLQLNCASKAWKVIRPDFTPMPHDEFPSVKALTTNTTVSHVEMGIVKTNGEINWILLTATPLQLKGYGVVISYVDITELKRQEQAIKASENRFRSIIEISPVPMALNDNQQNITFLNPAFTRMFGYDINDIPTVADWWSKAYPDPEYREWVETTWQTLLTQAEKQEKKHVTPIELVIRCKQGIEKTVLASAAIMSNGFFDEQLVVLYDITAQKQTETELLEEREQLENEVLISHEELEKMKIESDKISAALDVILNHRETNPNNAKNKLSQEINTVVLPLFKKIRRLCNDRHQLGLVDMLENYLQQLNKSYGVDTLLLPNDTEQLTPVEMQIALLIKQGLATKTIASMLNISPDTVCTHRKHIRKKLNLDGKSCNLRSHLMALLKE